MQISFRVSDTLEEIQRKILHALLGELKGILRGMAPILGPRFKELIRNAIVNQPEYYELMYGDLRHELGLGPETNRPDIIINSLIERINVEFLEPHIVGNEIYGKITVNIAQSSFDEQLKNDASVIDPDVFKQQVGSPTIGNSESYNWLQMLLFEGGNILVVGYHYTGITDAKSVLYSRSGKGLMFKGGTWQVPAQFQGTKEDNWFIRAINSVEPQIYDILTKALIKAF